MFGAGFYAITDEGIAAKRGMTLGQQAFDLLKGGAVALQLRDKESSDSDFKDKAKELKEICDRFSVPLILNDRLSIAIDMGLPVHLGQEDVLAVVTGPHSASLRRGTRDLSLRRVLANIKFGISTHSLAQAKEAEKMGASYIGIGPVYATPTKPTYKAIGFDELERVIASVKIPAVAIGGLTMDDMDELRLRGVKNCAMVRAALEAEDISSYTEMVNSLLN